VQVSVANRNGALGGGHSINRISTPTGQITYRAPHSPDGHADRCMALALALRAAEQGHFGCSIQSVPRFHRRNETNMSRAELMQKLLFG
jgi:phage FluMu gp28-like protein